MNLNKEKINNMNHNFWIQQDEAESYIAKQYLKVKHFIEAHPKSSMMYNSIQIHLDDKEDFMKVMYGDIII